MNRGNKLLILAGALALLACAYLVIERTGVFESGGEASEPIVVSGASSAPVGFSWTWDGERVALLKDGDGWVCGSDASFPVNALYPSRMESLVSPLTAARELSRPAELLEYGLSQPWLTVTIEYADGESVVCAFGDQNALTGEYYMLPNDGDKVYMVSDTLASAFSYGLLDMVQMETVDSMSDVRAYTLTGPDGIPVTVTELSDSLRSVIVGLQWADCVTWRAGEPELAAYGLDEPNVCSVTYVTTEYENSGETDDGGSAVAQAVEREHSFVIELGDYTADGAYTYARLPGSAMVYTVSASTANALLLK